MNLIWIIISTLLGAVGQILIKTGMDSIVKPETGRAVAYILFYFKSIFSPFVFMGLASYTASMLIWIWVIPEVEISYARPIVASGYAIVVLYSFLFLHETITWEKCIGVALIVVGVILVARS